MEYIHQYSELTPQELRQLRYKRQYKNDVPAWDDSMVLLTKLVRDRVNPGSCVLDFGCGRGNFLVDELGEFFSEKIGFDVMEESVTGNTSMTQVAVGDPRTLPFDEQRFDTAVSLWVMEHVEHPEDVFREIHRVMRPGGVFAFVTPNKQSLLIRLRRLLSDGLADRILKVVYGREEKDVFSVFYRANTVNDIRRLAEQSGFAVELVVENADPSYTSFNPVTYATSKLFARIGGTWARPHVIAVLRKPINPSSHF